MDGLTATGAPAILRGMRTLSAVRSLGTRPRAKKSASLAAVRMPALASVSDAPRARRVLSALRQSSSSPVIAETDAGTFFVKLRGAGQGTAALVAEIVVAELAAHLGLLVPRWVPVHFDARLPSDDPHGELRSLLDRSEGLNLGFELLSGARDLRREEAPLIAPFVAAPIVWFDALVQNVDRTPQNPNLMRRGEELWLIDHGAALTFQHDWSDIDEDSPREPGTIVEKHLFRVTPTELRSWDEAMANALPRKALEQALASVPDAFLKPLLGESAGSADLARERGAYVAFLWKRLKVPRPFLPAY